jgi:predicted alpha/beta hydrolase family esterase
MPQRILFIQGGGEGAHDHWDDKLVESLEQNLGRGYEVRYPYMPKEDDPQYKTWKIAIERATHATVRGANRMMGSTYQTNRSANDIPAVGPDVLDLPKPYQ